MQKIHGEPNKAMTTIRPVQQVPSMTTTVPFKLHANDVVKHIINVDSRFRDTPMVSSSSNFYYTLLSPMRNILRMRVTSVEFPNNYYIFSAARRNTVIQVIYDTSSPKTANVEIPEGNYTAGDMQDALNEAFVDASLNWVTAAFDETTGGFTFVADRYFAINTQYGGWDRPFDYGLGFNLGFSRRLHISQKISTTPLVYRVTSDQCATFQGDNYVFLRVNDYGRVRQTLHVYDTAGRTQQEAQSFTALAKVVLREPKNFMTFDDYASHHAKEHVFPSPIDLTRFKVEVLDAYGNVMDLCSSQFSFSLELLEVRNASLYMAIRDSLAAQYLD